MFVLISTLTAPLATTRSVLLTYHRAGWDVESSPEFASAVSQILEQKDEWASFAHSTQHYSKDGTQRPTPERQSEFPLSGDYGVPFQGGTRSDEASQRRTPVARARWMPRTSVPFFSVLLIGVLVPETQIFNSESRSKVPAVSTANLVMARYGMDM